MKVTRETLPALMRTLGLSYDEIQSKKLDDIFDAICAGYIQQVSVNQSADNLKELTEAYHALCVAYDEGVLARIFTQGSCCPVLVVTKEDEEYALTLNAKMIERLVAEYELFYGKLSLIKNETLAQAHHRALYTLLDLSPFDLVLKKGEKTGTFEMTTTHRSAYRVVDAYMRGLRKRFRDNSPLTQTLTINTSVQLAFLFDVSTPMQAMIQEAVTALPRVAAKIQASTQGGLELTTVTYRDYEDEGRSTTSGTHFTYGYKPEKLMTALDYPGKNSGGGQPTFIPSQALGGVLAGILPKGGGKQSNMVEAALALATQLPWKAPVRSVYLTLSAPPGAHMDPAKLFLVKSSQVHLHHDPFLKKALAPEDWFTQVLVLARMGVKIHPIVATTESGPSLELLFLATFMASLTGGTPMVVHESQWSALEVLVQKNTEIDCSEVLSAGWKQTFTYTRQITRPADKFAEAVQRVLSGFNMDALFSGTPDLLQLASELRGRYAKELRQMIESAEQELLTRAVRNDSFFEGIHRRVIAQRGDIPVQPASGAVISTVSSSLSSLAI